MGAKTVIKQMRRAIPLVLSLVCMCFFTLARADAQVATADIVGTVTDPGGAAVTSATVTATSLATGITQKAVVGNSGDFDFTLLQVGAYKVSVQAAGFKSYATQVTLAAGDRARITAKLELGQVTETVTVGATTPALQTETSDIGTLLTSQATQDLPLNGRNVTDLITLAAGVTGGMPNALASGTRPDDRRQSAAFAANGQSDQYNNMMIDGMDNNERFIGGVGVRPSIDAIQEVRVLTNLYSAEISRSMGGVVDLITKSGGNKFHGTLYEYLRNDMFDAKDYFATTGPKPELRQNQFGGSVGGPIWKQKTFFFFDYEDFRKISGVTANSTVPTLFEEQNPGNFSDLGTGCVNLTANSGWTPDTIGLNYFKLFPAPTPGLNSAPPGNCAAPAGNFSYTAGSKQMVSTYDAKVDHRISANDSLYARYTYNDTNAFEPAPLPTTTVAGITVNPGAGPWNNNFPGPATDQEQSAALGYTHLFASNLILELKAQYMRLDNVSNPINVGIDAATAFGFPGGSSPYAVNLPGDLVSSGLPNIQFGVQGYSALGDADYVPLHDQNNSFQYLGAVSWIKGAHSFKFGAGVIRRQGTQAQSAHPRGYATVNSNDPTLPGGGTAGSGNDLAVLLNGLTTSTARSYSTQTPDWRGWEPSIYAEDNWHALPKLTLNLGVRYDIFTPFTAANNAFDYFDLTQNLLYGPGLTGGQKSNATGGVKTDYADVAPRLGFAYEVKPGLVVRGGYGISFMPANSLNSGGYVNSPYAFNMSCGDTNSPINSPTACVAPLRGASGAWYMDGGLPVPSVDPSLVTNPANYINEGTIFSMDPDIKNIYLQQFSLNVEKDFFHGNVATISYVGNRGSRIPELIPINQLPYAGAAYPISALPGVIIDNRESVGSSSYDALQTSVERRLQNGLAYNVNYTWSHGLVDVSGIGEGNAATSCIGPCHVDNGSGQAVTYNSFYQYDHGNSDLDVRQRITLTMTYDIPFGKTITGPAAYVVKGWTVNSIYYAQTGNPITIASSVNPSGLPVTERPNQSTGTQGFHRSINEWYDVTQFRLPGTDLLGNAHRNSVFGPGTQALDFSVFKYIPLYDAIKLQFRAESFNLLNTPTFSQPGGTVSFDGNGVGQIGNGAGVITSTPASASPRQLQLALKLIF
jgi:outer membrane receptor protein involved in Fe transport